MRKFRSTPLTARVAAEIKRLAASGELMQHQIAAVLGLNQGRVSEVLSGKRFPDVQP
jgi:predicted XRE-type DNA-binding protein